MGSISNYMEMAILNQWFRGVPTTLPSTIYIGLYISNPTDMDIGTEVSGGGYARQVITFSEPQIVDGKALMSNNERISYAAASADWGNITHIALRDAATGGQLLAYAELTIPKIITNGDQLSLNIGAVSISID